MRPVISACLPVVAGLSSLIAGLGVPTYAQTTFTTTVGPNPVNPTTAQTPSGTLPYYVNGYTDANKYGQSIDGTTGVVSGTSYTFNNTANTGTGTIAGASTSIAPIEYSNNFGAINGLNFTEGQGRIFTSFSVPTGASVTLQSLTFYAYVKDSNGYLPASQSPFGAAHIALYNLDPNNFGTLGGGTYTSNQNATEQAALLGGDDSFGTAANTPNYLGATTADQTANQSFINSYRITSSSDTADATRPIYTVKLDLTQSTGTVGAISALTLGPGAYFFAVSVDVNQSVAPGASAFVLQADSTAGTANSPTGQPTFTNGSNGLFFPPGSQAGPPDSYQSALVGNSNFLAAFPYLLGGTIEATPEPGTFALFVSVLGPVAGIVYRRRRRAAA
jgi:hypothetical protein